MTSSPAHPTPYSPSNNENPGTAVLGSTWAQSNAQEYQDSFAQNVQRTRDKAEGSRGYVFLATHLLQPINMYRSQVPSKKYEAIRRPNLQL